jgi:hypothetical protein
MGGSSVTQEVGAQSHSGALGPERSEVHQGEIRVENMRDWIIVVAADAIPSEHYAAASAPAPPAALWMRPREAPWDLCSAW